MKYQKSIFGYFSQFVIIVFQLNKVSLGLPTQTEKNPLKTPDFSQKIP
jgi:hypothetical protein